jgi:hypothetical protein
MNPGKRLSDGLRYTMSKSGVLTAGRAQKQPAIRDNIG